MAQPVAATAATAMRRARRSRGVGMGDDDIEFSLLDWQARPEQATCRWPDTAGHSGDAGLAAPAMCFRSRSGAPEVQKLLSSFPKKGDPMKKNHLACSSPLAALAALAALVLLCSCLATEDDGPFTVTFSTARINVTVPQGTPPRAAPFVVYAIGRGPSPNEFHAKAIANTAPVVEPFDIVINPDGRGAAISIYPDTSLPQGL